MYMTTYLYIHVRGGYIHTHGENIIREWLYTYTLLIFGQVILIVKWGFYNNINKRVLATKPETFKYNLALVRHELKPSLTSQLKSMFTFYIHLIIAVFGKK